MHTTKSFTLTGQLVDVYSRSIYPVCIEVCEGIISSIRQLDSCEGGYIMPGFIDAHVHIESSMVVPAQFACQAVCWGAVAVVSDPHEIANVCGVEGVNFMIANGLQSPLKFFFGAPSCVPATSFETSGAVLSSVDVAQLLSRDDIWYLSEMMNYPGVLFNDAEVMAKLQAARRVNKLVDGHAPGLSGERLKAYANAGIVTDHECSSLQEALEKASLGMHILIREGSAAKNFESLIELIRLFPNQTHFCSDDLHPDDLLRGHINLLVKRAVAMGYDLFDVIRAASVNQSLLYSIPVGSLRVGDAADFIVVDNLTDFTVAQTYINGNCVYNGSRPSLNLDSLVPVNRFGALPVQSQDIELFDKGTQVRVIQCSDGDLLTQSLTVFPAVKDGRIVSDPAADVLKLVVVNRYQPASPAIGLLKGFGLQKGAVAVSVAHDSHNIIACGVTDAFISKAVNELIAHKGGLVYVDDQVSFCLPLPVGGLMSNLSVSEVAQQYETINRLIKQAGSGLTAPVMTLSFMSLLVIPSLKLGDRGLFDVETFTFTSLYVD